MMCLLGPAYGLMGCLYGALKAFCRRCIGSHSHINLRRSDDRVAGCWVLFWLPVLVLLDSVPLRAQDVTQNYDEPVLTVRLLPAAPYLQEQIVQSVSLVSAHPFETLQLRLPEVSGTRALTLQKPRSRAYATYGFSGYVYETSRALFAKHSGSLTIPAVRIVGSIQRPDRSIVAFDRVSDAVVLEVAPQAAQFAGDHWLIATDLKLAQSYSKSLPSLRVGDIVTRTITITAHGVSAEQLPLPVLRRTRYITVIDGPVTRHTTRDAEGVSAELTQTFDIQIDDQNLIDFAPVTLVWWDATTDQLRRASVPAVRIEPLPKDRQALVSRLMQQAQQRHDQSRFALTVVVGVLVMMVLLALAVWAWLKVRSARAATALRKAVRANPDPAHACMLLNHWARQHDLRIESPELTWATAAKSCSNRQATDAYRQLQVAAFGDVQGSADVNQLVALISRTALANKQRRQKIPLPGLVRHFIGEKNTLPEPEA